MAKSDRSGSSGQHSIAGVLGEIDKLTESLGKLTLTGGEIARRERALKVLAAVRTMLAMYCERGTGASGYYEFDFGE